jgi:hypothetical protein
VPTWLVKRTLPLLAETIALMCNLSITEGVFPDALKHAIGRPTLKKLSLDPAELSLYRPISNLSFISKTVERVVDARFSEHVETEHLLPSNQSAYPANHATETAVTAIELCVTSILARYLFSYYWISVPLSIRSTTKPCCKSSTDASVSTTMLWFDSYLANRKQSFQQGAQRSGPHPVDCSVPQGSVLGPQKFNAYTKGLEKLIKSHHLAAPSLCG